MPSCRDKCSRKNRDHVSIRSTTEATIRWAGRRIGGVICRGLVALALTAAPLRAQAAPLVVFNAGSLAKPMQELLRAFAAEHPDVVPAQENSGSVDAARKLTELGRIPDVLAVADYGVIGALLMPAEASWYATFARNAMVLAYADGAAGADRLTADGWWRILLEPGVRTGRSDPRLDPGGYRALMVFQLAERHYRQPGLAARLEAAAPPRYMRPNEVDLTALLQAGELDYAWTYASVARTHGLRFMALPPALDLSDPAQAAAYATAQVTLPPTRAGGTSLRLTGEPIVYALTIPRRAPHPATAAAFVRFVLGPRGRAVLSANGFTLMPAPLVTGTAPAGVLP